MQHTEVDHALLNLATAEGVCLAYVEAVCKGVTGIGASRHYVRHEFIHGVKRAYTAPFFAVTEATAIFLW